MAVLRSTAAMTMALSAGCYSPDLRDCVVACARDRDCGPGQVCGPDGQCAVPELAGTCGTPAVIADAGADAAPPTSDAAPDAPPPPDAPATIALTVHVSGRGQVTVVGIGTCGVSLAPCTYQVLPGQERTLVAEPAEDWSFDKWQSVACTGQYETCSYTPSMATTVQAKFKNGED